MTRENVLKELEEIIRDAFDDDTLVISEQTCAADIDGWDSLRQISIIAAAEDVFDIKLAISDTRNLKNIGSLADLILGKMK